MRFKIQKTLVVFLLGLFAINSKAQTSNKLSIQKALIEFSYDDIDAAIKYYKELKEEERNTYNFDNENELNSLGYRLINDGRQQDALKVFKLLVTEFPEGSNGFDSLGEVYYLLGDYAKATSNYEKSLQLNPLNSNAERFIVRIAYEDRDKNKFDKVYTRDQYIADLNELANTLTTINPDPYKFSSKEDFWSVVEQKKKLVTDSTTYPEFVWHCSELVANINCGHSKLPRYFTQENEMLPDSLRFPLELYNVDKRLYVVDALVNTGIIKHGIEVMTINGISSEQLIEEINKHIGSQGNTENPAKRHLFNWQATAMIPYAMGFPSGYEVLIKESNRPIKLNMLTSYSYDQKNLTTCNKTLCLDFLGKRKQTALLTIKHWDFYGSRLSIIHDFIDESIRRINLENTKNLIIDVRGNGGGNSSAASHLLQYLVDRPYTYFKEAPEGSRKLKPLAPFSTGFKGNVYVIADGRSGSTTGQFLALIKEHGLGSIIGEESNGGVFYTGGQRMFKLPNTEVFYTVGRSTNITNAKSTPINRGVSPDYYSVQTLKDYFEERDTALHFTMDLIKTAAEH